MKTIVKAIILSIFTLTIVGCSVKTNELTPQETVTLKNKSVVLSKYDELPGFAAQTALNVQFGLLGVATAFSNGNDMIKNNDIKDPAYYIAEELAKGLQTNYNVKILKNDRHVDAKNDINNLIDTYGDAEFILDVKTLNWSSIYYLSDWDNYKVIYTAHAKLIDVKSKQIVAEEVCTHIPEYADTNKAPTYEELENGTGLKKSLEESVKYCAEQIRTMAKLYNQENNKLTLVNNAN